MQIPFLGRAPRTKETLLDFLKWSRVTRHPLVFCELTGSQRTPGVWGVTYCISTITYLHLLVLGIFSNKVVLLAVILKIYIYLRFIIYTMFQLYGNVSSILLMLWDGAYSKF